MKMDRENRGWLNDYMLLKQVNANNPFTVPEGYFDELGQRLISYSKLDEFKKPDPLQGFAVPENYFEELSSKIQSRITIETALNTETPAFTVPEGYFENLQQQITSRIFVEEALNTETPAFAVPEGYFAKLNENILSKTVNEPVKKPKATVIQLLTSNVFKYATAACLTLIVGGALFLNQYNNPVNEHNRSFLHQSLLTVPADEIKSYLQTNLDESDTKTLIDDEKQINNDKVSNDLQDYIDTSQ